jgi:hypothetical protein
VRSGGAHASVALATLLLLALPVAGPPSGAPRAVAQEVGVQATPPPGPRAAELTVTAIDTVVGRGVARDAIGVRLLIENRTAAVWELVEVELDLHGRLGSRSALRAALAGGDVPALLRRTRVEASPVSLAPGDIALAELAVPLTGLTPGSGIADVLPLRLRVLADGVEVGRLDTAVLHLETGAPVPVATAVVWPVTAVPARDVTGTVAAVLDPQTRPGGRLDTLVRTLAGASGELVTLAPSVTLLEDLARRALERGEGVDAAADRAQSLEEQLIASVRSAASAPIALPYADADLARVLASPPPVRRLAPAIAFEGARRLAPLTGRAAAPITLLEHPTDARTLDLVAGGVVLLPYGATTEPDLALDLPFVGPSRPMTAPSGRLLTGVVADPFVTAAIAAGARQHFSARSTPQGLASDPLIAGGPVLAAHDVLVRTAMVFAEAPGRSGRGLLVLPPPGFDPDPRFLTALLDGLATAPWLQPVTPAALALTTSGGTATSSAPLELAPTDATPVPARLVQAVADVVAARQLLLEVIDEDAPDGDVELLRLAGRDLDAVSDELLRVLHRGSDLREIRANGTNGTNGEGGNGGNGGNGPAGALTNGLLTGVESAVVLESLTAALRASLGDLSISSVEVTLTARDGTLPLTLRHSGGVPLRLVVDVTGPAALSWPDGTQRRLTLGADEERTLELPLRAGSTGTFPVLVRISTPGGTVLAEETLSVRATALAGPALVGIGIVVAVLLIAGTVRQRRRGHRARRGAAA